MLEKHNRSLPPATYSASGLELLERFKGRGVDPLGHRGKSRG
jgi:hypothetical protein